METLRGPVTNCQHTLNVSGGGRHTSTTTTYITLFRVNGRVMEFRSSRPSSVSDGDQVAVAGLSNGATLTVLAFRNFSTGEVMNTGIVGNFLGSILLAAVGVFLCQFVVASLGGLAVAAGVLLIFTFAAHLAYRGVLTIRAEKLVYP